ncbi:ubiquitin family protein [Pseudomonas antarctica]|uniref:hypothetical protein n=1 Tax=Pseudomonas antarctica TaxID=219572 RepID=UPI0009F2EBDD|nr:hypothetical protein [Pseudomonas antarctica]
MSTLDGVGSGESITLQVVGSEGAMVVVRVKRTAALSKVMIAYSERLGVEVDFKRFHVDGESINETDTPNQLGLEDGDAIHFD